MLSAKQCKPSADLCNKLAAEAQDHVEKQILVGMANQWRRLANLKNKRERRKKLDPALAVHDEQQSMQHQRAKLLI